LNGTPKKRIDIYILPLHQKSKTQKCSQHNFLRQEELAEQVKTASKKFL